MIDRLLDLWLIADEPIATVLGFVIVVCFIRQNVWAWPLGVAYVLVLVSVLIEARLYANLALHVLAFLPMNLYGWYYWLVGGKRPDESDVPVTRAGVALLAAVLAICALGTVGLGRLFAALDAELAYWDTGILVCSIATMWLTARKKIENWIFWFVIDVVQVGVYWAQGLALLAGLYFVYLGMAVAGWLAWQRSMHDGAAAAEAGPAPP